MNEPIDTAAESIGWDRFVIHEVYCSVVDGSFFVTNNPYLELEKLQEHRPETFIEALKAEGWSKYGICFRWDDKPVDLWEKGNEYIAVWLEKADTI